MTTTNLNSIRGLNPCCNGIYLIMANIRIDGMSWCLNPCCNGIYLIMAEELLNDTKKQS